jgi:hypothetical protein
MTRSRRTRSIVLWMALLGSLAASLAIVLLPAILIWPFRRQTSSIVAISFQLRRAAPLATVVLLGVVLALAVALFRRQRRLWLAAPIALLVALAAGSAWLARQNHFEWFFQPISDPQYAPVAEASWMADSDMVMAVEIAGDAVAYPMRQMGYHHIVNTSVGGLPVVGTY